MQQDFHAKVSDRVNYDNNCRSQMMDERMNKRPPIVARAPSSLRSPQNHMSARQPSKLPVIDNTDKIMERHEKELEFGRRRSTMNRADSMDTSHSMDNMPNAIQSTVSAKISEH